MRNAIGHIREAMVETDHHQQTKKARVAVTLFACSSVGYLHTHRTAGSLRYARGGVLHIGQAGASLHQI